MARITDAQVKELRRQLQHKASLQMAALKTGMDRQTAAKYREGKMPSERRQTQRSWRTRVDPLAAVWPEVQSELERAPGLQAQTLRVWLQERFPGQFGNEVLRTLQCRIKQWRALHGRRLKIAEEVTYLCHLPARRLETLVRLRVKVSQGTTIRVLKNTYSVPARLKGEVVEARVGTETVEV